MERVMEWASPQTSKQGFGLVEALVAVMLFTLMCLPLYRLYFQQGLSQQRMIRDFLAVTNVSEKVLNRIDHQLERVRRPLIPLQKEVTAEILIGMQEEGDWSFLGQAFNDDSGRMAFKYIPAIKSEVEFRGFSLDPSAISADQRNNNPKLLQEVLETINRRGQLVTVDATWQDSGQLRHDFRLKYIRTLKPEF